jgi:acyl carrier protein
MAAIFDDAPEWPGLRGVVHAAGVFDPCAAAELDADRVRAVLRSKVDGSLVLDGLAATAEVDFFVMFSSASAVWGSALAGHYGAANHFLDALAHDRVRRGRPGLAVNWGWWAGSDMVDAGHAAYFESMGLHVVPDELGFAALDRLLAAGRTQLTVAPVDWDRFRPILAAKRRRPLLELLGGKADRKSEVDTALLDRVRSSPPAARARLVEDRVQAEVAAVLGNERPLDRDHGFFDAGMDSITSVELRSRLEAAFGLPLPATVSFEHPTVAALAAYLLAELLPPEAAVEADDLTALSEDDLLRLLSEELERE